MSTKQINMNFTECILNLQEFAVLNDHKNLKWKQFEKFLNSVDVLLDHEEQTELLQNLFTKVINDQFLETLSDALVKISPKELSEDSFQTICKVLARFDDVSRPRRCVESCLKELTNAKIDTCITEHVKRLSLTPKFCGFDKQFLLSQPALKQNKITEAYNDLEEYLNIHRMLISQDFLIPLRSGISDIESHIEPPQNLHSYGFANILTQDEKMAVLQLKQVSTKIDWSSTSRLIYGSMIVIVQGESIYFYSLQERNIKDKCLELVLNTLDPKQQPLELEKPVQVFESKAYFEAYKHVIQALYSIRKIPFRSTLFKMTKSDLQTGIELQMNEELLKKCNESQRQAVKLGIEKKIALIQGPPGTGKSFVGTILAKLFIKNKIAKKPVVVICFTNHALDHFLESLLGFTDNIVRIGSRSKSTKLEPHLLTAIKKHLMGTSSRNKQIYQAIKASKSFIKDWNDVENIEILNNADVIGMTSTGAAKNFKLLRMLDPKAMIIEEAGQVLEGHVLASLTPNLEHLILIGDHKQLRPSVTTYQLARDFSLDVSLFERLIRNGFQYVQLLEQHRMRPDISTLVKNEFYPDLIDHHSVKSYGNVNGMESNVYFINHTESESVLDDSQSKINLHEAEFLLNLSKYLIKYQGYPASKITILASYLGQMILLQKLNSIEGLEITTVDNYQGEENEIILLSLVRSNQEASIGYLNVQSRICVALSRAKVGLYIIGNISDLSQSSKTWRSLAQRLKSKSMLGSQLVLQCQFHPLESRFQVTNPQDFTEFQCKLGCQEQLGCGHQCGFQCHVQDRDHRQEYKCQVIELKTMPDCGHQAQVECGSNERLCKFPVQKSLSCGHIKDSYCGEMNPECNQPCTQQLDCGHQCLLPCHQNSDHNKKCSQPCSRLKLKCSSKQGHPCNKLCYQPCNDCDEIIEEYIFKDCQHLVSHVKCSTIKDLVCQKKCDKYLSCGKHYCKNFCYECQENGCGNPCTVNAEKKLPCGHVILAPCQGQVSCLEPCTKTLNCGHSCPLKCFEDCSLAKCSHVVIQDDSSKTRCGHQGSRLCHEQSGLSSDCSSQCQKIMECGHQCSHSCADCLNGQVHLPCIADCQRILVCGHKCSGKCGEACQPCSRLKCLVQLCQHKKCKSLCEDDCNDCKDKCLVSCDHGRKCSKKCYLQCNNNLPCHDRCQKTLPCGHQCQGFCGEVCPQKACSKCNDDIPPKAFVQLPQCGHCVENEVLESLLEDNIIGLLECPTCQMVIGDLPARFKAKLKSRKKAIVQVFDYYFVLKSNLSKTKHALIESTEKGVKLFDHVKARCEDKTNPLTLAEFQVLQAKLALLDQLKDKETNPKIIDFLSDSKATISPSYIKSLLKYLSNQFIDVSTLKSMTCFSKGSWKMSENCIQSTLFSTE